MTRAYTYTKRIGNSRYIVNVSFDEKANDTFEDKMLKLIEQDAAKEENEQQHNEENPTQPAA